MDKLTQDEVNNLVNEMAVAIEQFLSEEEIGRPAHRIALQMAGYEDEEIWFADQEVDPEPLRMQLYWGYHWMVTVKAMSRVLDQDFYPNVGWQLPKGVTSDKA